MDSIKSFKGYGKVDEIADQAFRRNTRKRMLIIAVSVVVLLTVIIAAIVGVAVHRTNNDDSSSSSSPTTLSDSIKSVCSVTQYPNSCFSSLSSLESTSSNNKAADPEVLFKLSMEAAVTEVSKLSALPEKLMATTNDVRDKAALVDCQSLYQEAIDQLNNSISSMQSDGNGKLLSASKIDDLKTWLSAALTDLQTCLDGLQETNSTAVTEVKTAMQNSVELTSNSLAIVSKILSLLQDFNLPIHRKLLGFPEWVGPSDRKLLQQEGNTTTTTTTTEPNVTVAKDGTGKFSTITEAVAAVPKQSKSRFLIYVKQGVYEESVVLDKSKWNVMMYGDGKTKTIISGNLSFVGGTPTFSTATFVVVGKGFIAKDIGFRNTAGAVNHQAVALRSGSDLSVFYRCSFDAFQDTLYAHSNRQFYRECDITGTIDFIFGNAAVIFQSCNIQPRQPMANQYNTITAQGKTDPNQNAGISIQRCSISALDNVTVPTYLGRPWKNYSTTVFMQSTISAVLDPTGWTPWIPNTIPLSTIFYGEYYNTGPGSALDKRVKWEGYNPSITDEQASKFTVSSFIKGSEWLPQTTVSYDASLQ